MSGIESNIMPFVSTIGFGGIVSIHLTIVFLLKANIKNTSIYL
jgi:hypothetical protein